MVLRGVGTVYISIYIKNKQTTKTEPASYKKITLTRPGRTAE